MNKGCRKRKRPLLRSFLKKNKKIGLYAIRCVYVKKCGSISPDIRENLRLWPSLSWFVYLFILILIFLRMSWQRLVLWIKWWNYDQGRNIRQQHLGKSKLEPPKHGVRQEKLSLLVLILPSFSEYNTWLAVQAGPLPNCLLLTIFPLACLTILCSTFCAFQYLQDPQLAFFPLKN